MKLGQFVDLLLIIVVFLQSFKINQLEKLLEVKSDKKEFLYYFYKSTKYVISVILFLVLMFFLALVISMIIDLSTDGLRFAGEYETYYWSDIFKWIGNIFE